MMDVRQVWRGVWCGALLGLVLAGCDPLLPRKSDLDAVHAAYRADFAKFFLVESTNKPACILAPDFAFDDTLEAIRAFEAKYRGERSSEMGHATVLKAMVYLQARKFGVARAMIPQVQAASLAVADDRDVRDTLFKNAYADLVDGWHAACESVAPASPTVIRDGTFSARNEPRSKVLTTAAKNIVASITASTSRPAKKGVEADDGAIYLATSAAIFDLYALRMKEDECRGLSEEEKQVCIARAAEQFKGVLRAAAANIYSLLTADERKAAAARDACKPTVDGAPVADDWGDAPTAARRRYVLWYLDLKGRLPCTQ